MLPLTVVVVAVASGLLISRGVTQYPPELSSLPPLLDPLYYVGTLFAHSSTSHFVTNMYFFVPAGLALTYLAGNRRVLAVIVTAHLPAAVVASYLGTGVVGTTAAAYGLLAAVLVRAAWKGTEIYDPSIRVASSVCVFAFAGVALLLATGGAITVQFAPILGFLAGGALETRYVLTKFAHEEPDKSGVPADYAFGSPGFQTRWQNMADDEEEAEKLEKMYSGNKASRDDTRSGSGGRRRTD
ncbi:MAG: rhomboid family intramembrane serine protease [Halobacteriales archaeon]|nr:rhomboid family intramembrane serine protease [Halobacteriales archaeon]